MIPLSEPNKVNAQKPAAPHVISVTSGKGGVGKTSIVANIAIILSSLGRKVLVFDADLGLANIDIMLGLSVKNNISDLLAGRCLINDILVEGPGGIKIIPASSGIQELSNLTYEQQLSIMNALDDLSHDFDYMLVDTGAGISGNVMYFNSAAQRVIVVVTPEPTSITDAYAVIKILRNKYRIKKFDLIINNVLTGNEARTVMKKLIYACDKFFGDIALDMLGSIPHDSNIPECVKQQKAFVNVIPGSEASMRLTAIVNKIENAKSSNDRGTIQFFFKRHIEEQTKG